MALRLRQVALVAADLDHATTTLGDALGIDVCFRDPGVGEFGLLNALFAVGDSFVEVVSPNRPGTTAGRLLDKRAGDGGYMVILQCDDLDRRRARLAELGVRVVWQLDLPDISGTHLHPRDVGGAIVSIDEARPWPSWRWAGPTWRDHVRTGTVSALAGVVVGADDPTAMAARWADVLDVACQDRVIVLDDATRIAFEPAGERGEGVDAIEVVATDRGEAGRVLRLVGTEIRLV